VFYILTTAGAPAYCPAYGPLFNMLNGKARIWTVEEGPPVVSPAGLKGHILDPVVIAGGQYRVPSRPFTSAYARPETPSRVSSPAGADWRAIGKQ
jgi:hypothetical protein